MRTRLGKAVKHVSELSAVNLDVVFTVFLDCFLLCEAYLADGGVRKDDSGYVLVVHLQCRSVVEESLRQDSACSYGYWCQTYSSCHIPNCVYTVSSRVLEVVCRYQPASLVNFDSCFLQS